MLGENCSLEPVLEGRCDFPRDFVNQMAASMQF